nr:hypothetical protein [Tanacetum cinerariifolium]
LPLLVSWSSKKQDCTSMSSAEADHSHLVQSYPAFAHQAHRRLLSFHQREGRKRKVTVSRQTTWYEMFNSSRTGGSGK